MLWWWNLRTVSSCRTLTHGYICADNLRPQTARERPMSMESNSSKMVYRLSDSVHSHREGTAQHDGPMRLDVMRLSLATPRRSCSDNSDEHHRIRPCRPPLSARAVLQACRSPSRDRDLRDSSNPSARRGSGPSERQESARPGHESARPGLESARPGLESAGLGQESTRPEQENVRSGQENARPGQESARRGLILSHDEGCKIQASAHIKFGIIIGTAPQPPSRGQHQAPQTRHQQPKPSAHVPGLASLQRPPVSRSGLLHTMTPRGRDSTSRAGSSGMTNAEDGMKKGTLIGLIVDKRANGERGKVSLRSFSFKERQA
jgi:hypothetical protein